MNRVLSLESFRHNDVVSFVNWKQISCISRLGYSQNERIVLNTLRKQQVKDFKVIIAPSFPDYSLVKMTRGNSHGKKVNQKRHLKDSKFDSFVINNRMALKTSADN